MSVKDLEKKIKKNLRGRKERHKRSFLVFFFFLYIIQYKKECRGEKVRPTCFTISSSSFIHMELQIIANKILIYQFWRDYYLNCIILIGWRLTKLCEFNARLVTQEEVSSILFVIHSYNIYKFLKLVIIWVIGVWKLINHQQKFYPRKN